MSLIIALFGGLFLSVLISGSKVEAAAPAWECSSTKNGTVKLEGTCFFGESEEEFVYLDLNFTNSDEASKVTNLYFKDIEKGGYSVIGVAEGINSYDFRVPVKANETNIQTIEVYYVLNNGKIQKITLDTMKETNAPKVEIAVNTLPGEYHKEHTVKVSVYDNGQDDVGLKKILVGFAADEASLELKEIDEVTASQEFLTNYGFELTYNGKENANLYVVAEDFAGNVTKVVSEMLHVDNEAPVIAANLNSSDEVKSSHSVDFTVVDEKSGVKEVKYAWKLESQTWDEVNLYSINLTDGSARITTPGANGKYNYKIIAVDNLGNEAEIESGAFTVDAGSTAIVPSFIGNTSVPSASFTANVKVAASDSTSIEKIIMIWIPEGAARPGNPANVEEYEFKEVFTIEKGVENDITFSTTKEMTGSYSLFMFIIYNEADNTFGVYDDTTKLTIDTTAPTIYFTPASVEEYVKEANITISLTDENEFAEALYYVWAEASKELTKDEITETTTSGATVTLNGVTGEYRLWVLAFDKAGNEVIAKSEVYKLDNTAPVVELTEEMKEIYGKTTEVSLTITESDSGVASVKYAWSTIGGAVPTDAEYKVNKENKVYTDAANDGKYILYVIVTDKAGNETKAVFENEFLIDVQTPVIKGVSNNQYYRAAVTVEVEDGNLKEVEVCNKLTGLCNVTTENKVNVTEDGYYVVSAKDTADNVTKTIFVVNQAGKVTIGEDDYKAKSQMILPIQKDEGRYYISLPKGQYSKGNVLVLTKVVSGLDVRLNQKNNYIILEGEVIEILARRSDSITITDESAISKEMNEDGNYGYVVVTTMSNQEANGLGINTTIIDSEALALTVGLAGTLSLIGIFVIMRSKKNLRL